MRLRIGLVGLGGDWETRHRPALQALSDRFEVRAVCCDVFARAEQVAAEFGAQAVDGFRALTARLDVDAVLMLAPGWYGPLPILAACESEKAVYCAAALDIDPERAAEIKQRVERSGVAFMAEFPRRQMPATIRLKELMATRLGAPQLLFCHERRSIPSANRNGHPYRGPHCPSAIRNLMELVDWCRYVVGGEPTSVVGVRHADPHAESGENYQMMSLDFVPDKDRSSGALAQISCGRYLHPDWHEAVSFRPPAELQVCCEKGIAFVDLPAGLVWFDEAGRHLESLETDRPVGEQLLTQFHRAVTSLVRKTCDLEDTYRALQVVQAARRSWDQGSRVLL